MLLLQPQVLQGKSQLFEKESSWPPCSLPSRGRALAHGNTASHESPARPQEFLFLNQWGFSFTSPSLEPEKGTEETQASRGTNTHQEPGGASWQYIQVENTLFFTPHPLPRGPHLRRQDFSSLPLAESK